MKIFTIIIIILIIALLWNFIYWLNDEQIFEHLATTNEGVGNVSSMYNSGTLTATAINTTGAVTVGSITTTGAVTAGSLSTSGVANTKRLYTTGGVSSALNPNGYQTHFPYEGDGKNYIRGDTIVDGNIVLKSIGTGTKTEVLVQNGLWGDWTGSVMCPANTYVCGMKTRFEASQGGGDDTALNGISMTCCSFN